MNSPFLGSRWRPCDLMVSIQRSFIPQSSSETVEGPRSLEMNKCQLIESHLDSVAWTGGPMEQLAPTRSTGQLCLSGHRLMGEHRARPQTPGAQPIFTGRLTGSSTLPPDSWSVRLGSELCWLPSSPGPPRPVLWTRPGPRTPGKHQQATPRRGSSRFPRKQMKCARGGKSGKEACLFSFLFAKWLFK